LGEFWAVALLWPPIAACGPGEKARNGFGEDASTWGMHGWLLTPVAVGWAPATYTGAGTWIPSNCFLRVELGGPRRDLLFRRRRATQPSRRTRAPPPPPAATNFQDMPNMPSSESSAEPWVLSSEANAKATVALSTVTPRATDAAVELTARAESVSNAPVARAFSRNSIDATTSMLAGMTCRVIASVETSSNNANCRAKDVLLNDS